MTHRLVRSFWCVAVIVALATALECHTTTVIGSQTTFSIDVECDMNVQHCMRVREDTQEVQEKQQEAAFCAPQGYKCSVFQAALLPRCGRNEPTPCCCNTALCNGVGVTAGLTTVITVAVLMLEGR
ncbi:hypothetical protein PFISCL1PPCAC_2752 [Pristionchus fissidentatus]|uniref:UPAR/Ly6 domain-containing protein n=1 Tax=Pristionchus fissidentatus TaxID=1538716 RepID=A0AAV5UYX0_9BILA|nr:hypothetical protein PFISCL1PPCAC_2752 [Pristionchus fissidentatus]